MGMNADNMELDVAIFFVCMCNVPGICCGAISMWHSCTAFSFSFYINENVDMVNGYKHRINSSTQVFLQYICNWCEDATSCASPHWKVEQMTAILYIWTACMSLLTSTEFSWMDGKRSKRGYGNIHSRAYSGHVLRFLHVTGMVAMLWCFWQYGWTELWKWCRTMWRHLNLNTETWRFGYFWKMMFDINFLEKKNFVFCEIHLHLMQSGQQMNLGWVFGANVLRWSLTSFINSMCMMFFNNLNRMFSQLDCIFVSGSCRMFLTTFSMFLEFDKKMQMDRNVFGTTWWIRTGRIHRLWVRRSLWRSFYSEVVFACRRCLFTTEQTSQNKRSSNMHAACARHSWIDSSPCFVFLCGKGNWVLQWQPSCFWVLTC